MAMPEPQLDAAAPALELKNVRKVYGSGENEVVALDDAMSFTDAAALPLCTVTAWQMVFRKAQVRAGQATMHRGEHGPSVKSVQTALNLHGAHPALLGGNLKFAASDHLLFSVRREKMDQDLAAELAGDLLLDRQGDHELLELHRNLRRADLFDQIENREVSRLLIDRGTQ